MSASGMTLVEKIIARAAGLPRVVAGQTVVARVDLAMMHDSGGPRRVAPRLRELGAPIWDPTRVVLVIDHFVPAADEISRSIVAEARRFGAAERLGCVIDEEGICHVVVAERGFIRPGMFIVGGDSHSTTGGAFGAYMFGIGSTDMVGVLATGETWIEVPETIRIDWTGRLGKGVSAKDMMLFLCGRLGLGGADNQAIEYGGEACSALPIQERMTLANMTAEVGGQVGIVPPDEITAIALGASPTDASAWSKWVSDEDAHIAARYVFSADDLVPQVARPHTPASAAPIDATKGTRIDVAYIGACTGAKLVDLQMAAEVLKNRKIAPTVTLLVAPASKQDQEEARKEGTLAHLLSAGGQLLPNACGICAGYGAARFDQDVTAISTTARNFRGRMGAQGSQVYLASPYTVAASALEGRIADPRPYLDEAA